MDLREFCGALCREYANEHHFSGVCMLKKGDTPIFEKAYGFANRAFRIPNRVDTRFDTASITKIFTAAAVLQLVQKGLLSLDGRITEIVDLSGTKIPRDVTIESLLNHTSGIADDADVEAGEEYSTLFADSPNYAIRECGDFLKNFAYKEPNFKAGTNVRYCNCSFVLLGMAIEAVTGLSYRTYVEKNIFAPAGMEHTAFLSIDGINENTAEGYICLREESGGVYGYRKNIYSYPPRGTPDGGAYTTAEDLNRFLDAVLGNVILEEPYSSRFLMPHCKFTQDKSWWGLPGMYERNGYGFEFLMFDEGKTPFCIYKDGQNDGVAARFSYYPQSDLRLVLLSNQDCDVWQMTREIQLRIYRHTQAQ